MKILIVDDEKWIRKAIIKILPYEKLGLELAGEASNGKEALEMCRLIKPDIVLTDIRMPEMDGLELSRNIKELLPDIKIVIVSGHDDFEYARAAIKYGVSGYILKPIDGEELEEILAELTNCYAESLKKTGKITAEISREALFIQLLEPNVMTASQIDLILSESGILFDHSMFTVIIFLPDTQIGPGYFESCKSLVSQIMSLYNPVTIIGNGYNEIISIINHLADCADKIEKDVYSAIKLIGEKTGYNFYAGISTHTNQLTALSRLYTEADKALNFHFWNEEKRVFPFITSVPIVEQLNIKISEPDIEDMTNNIEISNFEPANTYIDNLFNIMRSKTNLKADLAKEFIWSFFFLLMSRLDVESLINRVHSDPDFKNVYSNIRTVRSASELKKYAHSLIETIYHKCVPERTSIYTDVIEKAKSFIEQNYYKDICLEDTAQYAGLAPAYFSQLFKRKTGMNFTEYRTMVRITHAKQLCKSEMTVREISNAVGYYDYRHFGKVFKKSTGMSLTYYKKYIQSK